MDCKSDVWWVYSWGKYEERFELNKRVSLSFDDLIKEVDCEEKVENDKLWSRIYVFKNKRFVLLNFDSFKEEGNKFVDILDFIKKVSDDK